jgi:hypothetical protein
VRESSDDVKGSLETVAEAFCLSLLTLGWVPSVIVVTTPGGFASQLGNAYFWTWGTTIFVMETFLWFIHDYRGNVQRAILEKENEYKEHKAKVLKESLKKHGGGGNTDQEFTNSTEDALKSELGDSSHDELDLREETTRYYGGRQEDAVVDGIHEKESNGLNEDSVEYERHMKMENRKDYFNSLDDILE